MDNVGVIGAGLMGSEIALVCALAGRNVILTDTNAELLARAMSGLGKVLDKGLQRGFYREGQKEEALARITPEESLEAHADRDLVVEAVFENEEVKGGVFRALDGILRPEACIASNTSTISITTLASYVSPSGAPASSARTTSRPCRACSSWR